MAEDLTRTEYEKRFWQRWGADYKTNFLGFGVDNPWHPPIMEPTSLLAEWDKHWLTVRWFGNFITASVAWFWDWITKTGTGDALDWYWYNNADAAGAQMYPTGVNKYYDMYSLDGYWNFIGSLMWYELCDVIGSLFLFGLPLDFVLGWINGLTWDNFGEVIWYYVPGGDWMVWGWNIKV